MKRKFTVLALAFAMVLTMSASVFAAGTPDATADQHAAGSAAKFVKYLKIPDGVTVPGDAEFEFKFTPVAPATEDAHNETVPTSDYTEKVLTFKVSDMADAGVEGTKNKEYVKTINELFAGYEFKRAGEYLFKVTETNKGFERDTADGKFTEKMLCNTDAEEYTLRLYVKNGTPKTIADVTVVDKNGDKVNPTDDDPTPADTDDPNGEEGFTFINRYSKVVKKHNEPTNPNPDPNPEDPANPDHINKNDVTNKDGAFVLTKEVLGEYGDQTKDFTFTATLTMPEGEDAADYDVADNKTGDLDLAHGESFTYKALPVGTKITIAENDYSGVGYTANWTSSDANNALTVLVGEDGAYVICRNAFDDNSVTPTGIIINNLPYVLLIGLALGGIVLFSRKRRYE